MFVCFLKFVSLFWTLECTRTIKVTTNNDSCDFLCDTHILYACFSWSKQLQPIIDMN